MALGTGAARALTALTVCARLRLTAMVMACGSGVRSSGLSLDPIDEAHRVRGFDATVLGFVSSGAVYTLADRALRRGATAAAAASWSRRSRC
ncbi:MAG TPA: hypothetical protein VEZ47_06705 [Gemmatirosa sp.]|nr:hypothetical protein [Gemmatirosa sp.]